MKYAGVDGSSRCASNIRGVLHVMNRGLSRRNIFLEDKDQERFLELLRETSRQGKERFWHTLDGQPRPLLIVEVRNYYCVESAVHIRVNKPWTVPFKRRRRLPSFHNRVHYRKSSDKDHNTNFDAPSQPAGNLATQRLLRSGVIQPKLAISQPDDVHEQEADRMAEQVMRMPKPTLQRTCAGCEAARPDAQPVRKKKPSYSAKQMIRVVSKK